MDKVLNGEKIFISTSTFGDYSSAPVDMLIDAGAKVDLNPHKRRLTKGEITDILAEGYTGLIAGLEPLDGEVMASSKLKVISRCGAGMSNVDLDEAVKLGITVRNTPDAPTDSVAELAIGALISAMRKISFMDAELHEKRWSKRIGVALAGKTVCIIGFGRIGRRVGELLKPFNVKIVVVDPFVKDAADDIEVLGLDDAVKIADIIMLHAGGDDMIIGEREVGLMKEGVFICNAGRGKQVSSEAVAPGLKSGKISGLWMDVFEDEPYSGELTEFDNVVLTPHVGSYTVECRCEMEMESAANLLKAFNEKQ